MEPLNISPTTNRTITNDTGNSPEPGIVSPNALIRQNIQAYNTLEALQKTMGDRLFTIGDGIKATIGSFEGKMYLNVYHGDSCTSVMVGKDGDMIVSRQPGEEIEEPVSKEVGVALIKQAAEAVSAK